jgi:tryptophan 2,3-dioxygenase
VKRKRVLPQTRDPALELSLVRNIARSTDGSRHEAVQETGGEPIVQFAGESNPFIDFHRNDVLHSLQHMRSEGHDEMTFIVMTQIKELTFKGLHYELINMVERVRNDDVRGALALVPRIRALFEFLVKSWDVLSTITAHGFSQFRDYLGISSGQQSYM